MMWQASPENTDSAPSGLAVTRIFPQPRKAQRPADLAIKIFNSLAGMPLILWSCTFKERECLADFF
jgi:hypothetical protein